jgi:hypothetical protein
MESERTKRPVPRKVAPLKLGEHPQIHWPPGVEPNPPWAATGPSVESPDPMHITLTEVALVEAREHTPDHLALAGNYHQKLYRTTLRPDDPALVMNLYLTLRKCIGETIARIGEHDVDRSCTLR